jgi:hypothetical protein
MMTDLFDFANSTKNILLEIAKKSKIPLSRFEIETKGLIFIINLPETHLKFRVRQVSANRDSYAVYYIEFEPDFPEATVKFVNKRTVSTVFRKWLTEHAEPYLDRLESPNKWAELDRTKRLFSHKSFTEEDFKKFEGSEKEQIRESLSEYRDILEKELKPVKEDLEFIKERLDYLANSLDRLNKYDWKGVSISTIIGIITNMTVDAATAGRLYEIFQQIMSTGTKLIK